MIVFAVWNKDYMSFLVKCDDGASFSTPVTKRGDPMTLVKWAPIRGEIVSFLDAGGKINEPGTQPPSPPPPNPIIVARDAAIAAGGEAKRRRDIQRLAKTDPVAAMILNGGLK